MHKYISYFTFACFLMLLCSCSTSRNVAMKHIEELKESVIFVRLGTSQNQIDYCLENNLHSKAEKIKNDQEELNKQIILGFEEYFDYCDFYFFSAEHAVDMRNGKFDHLFDAEGNAVSKPDNKNHYYASFRNAQVDSKNNQSDGSYMVIMDKNFESLEQPFPHFSWTWLLGRKDHFTKDEIQHLNSRLHGFYNNTAKRRSKERFRKFAETG